jgi:phosphatidylinositol alpha-1,6-mannosyltransferase
MHMRILCLVTDGFGGQGGIALHCRHMLRALCATGRVETVHALPRLKPHYPEELPEKLRYLDTSANSPFEYALALAKEAAISGRWNLVLCEHINLLWPAAVIATLHNAKLLLVIHGFESWQTPKRFHRWPLQRVHQVISVSNVTKERFLKWSGVPESRISVVANAIEPKDFAPGPRPHYLMKRYGITNEPVIMTLGRLSEKERSKGFDRVISILPDLLKVKPDMHYLIVGDGADRYRLERLSHERDVFRHVTFCGEINEHEKVDHYRLADAFVMPSALEGFGYVYLEALACGLPVVGSQADGSQDALLDGELGELINPDDGPALTAAVLRALEKPKLVPEQLKRFSLDQFNLKVEEILEQLVK